jgi:mono/diheme cytochrome c family protein
VKETTSVLPASRHFRVGIADTSIGIAYTCTLKAFAQHRLKWKCFRPHSPRLRAISPSGASSRSVQEIWPMKFVIGTFASLALAFTLAAAGDAAKGEKLYATKCKSCHGAQGQGNPAIAKATKVVFRDLKSPEVQKMSDAELAKLAMGGHGKKKPLKTVTPADVNDVIAYLRTMK